MKLHCILVVKLLAERGKIYSIGLLQCLSIEHRKHRGTGNTTVISGIRNCPVLLLLD